MNTGPMYVVMTRVPLKPGTEEDCAELFRQTNPDLVKDEPDWLGAQMFFEAETNTVTVLARWRSASAYDRFSSQPAFQQTMQRFAEFFAGPPQISKNTVLAEMARPEEPLTA